MWSPSSLAQSAPDKSATENSPSDVDPTPDEVPDFYTPHSTFEPPPAENPTGPTFDVNLRSRLTFRSDVKGTDADAQVSHSGLDIGMSQSISDQLTLSASLDFEFSYYDFGGGKLIAGVSDPFDDLYSLYGIITLRYEIDEQWSAFGMGFVGVAGESDADIDDSLLGGGGGGVGWSPNDWFRISVGLAVRSRLEDHAVVTPLISFFWRLSEEVRLQSRSLPQGTGIGLVWEVNEYSELTLFGGFESRQWRLDGGRGELNDGVIRDVRIPVGVAYLWRAAPGFTVELETGAIVYQEYEFLDDSGRRLEDLESDIAAFIGARIQWMF